METKKMKKISVVFVLLLVVAMASGCASWSGIPLRAAENKAKAQVVESQADVIVSDNEMYIERSEWRQQAIKDGDNAAASGESASQDGISISNGYKDGKSVIIINDSNYDLDIEIADSHGQVFKFRLDRGKSKGEEEGGFNLEVGNHRVRSFRARESNQRPFTETIMGVKSVPYFYYGADKDNRYCGYTIIRGGSGW